MELKIQDIVFIIVLIILLLIRRQKLFVLAGLLCFIIAIPLYAGWIFFTASKMVQYGAFFIFISVLYSFLTLKKFQ